jgi:serine/threonine-protein kinase
MGSVYEGVHLELNKRVAVKTLRPEYARNAQIRLRFLREGQAASRIRHPHAADVSDVGQDGDLVWLVMELLDGEDLDALLERQGTLPPERVADLLLAVLAALATAHEEGIIHRDIKPANIFLARGRHGVTTPKLLDFGISKIITTTEGPHDTTDVQSITGSAAILGTPFYMAPEQVMGARNASALSDQYAIGVILYRSVTGQLPFKAAEVYPTLRAIEIGVYTPPRQLVRDLPARFDAMVRRAMHREPTRRFASVHELGAELLQYASAAVKAQWAPVFGEAPVLFDDGPSAMATASVESISSGAPGTTGTTTLGGSAVELTSPLRGETPAVPARTVRVKYVFAGALAIALIASGTVLVLNRFGEPMLRQGPRPEVATTTLTPARTPQASTRPAAETAEPVPLAARGPDSSTVAPAPLRVARAERPATGRAAGSATTAPLGGRRRATGDASVSSRSGPVPASSSSDGPAAVENTHTSGQPPSLLTPPSTPPPDPFFAPR